MNGLIPRIDAMISLILGQGNEGDFDDIVCSELLLDCREAVVMLRTLPVENGNES